MQYLTLPNLINNSDTRISYTINNQSYMFHFHWCGTFCLLDIYIIRDNENIYLVKGRAITINNDIIARVKNSDLITGSLLFINRYGYNIEPSQDNFHTDFYLVYQLD